MILSLNDTCTTMFNVRQEPDLNEAKKIIEKGIEKRQVIIVTGECQVEYNGRASSKLERGERIVIIKADGAVLVHRARGYEPVNWMPGGKVVHQVTMCTRVNQEQEYASVPTRSAQKVLKVKAVRRKPVESVTIFFNRISLLMSTILVDYGKFFLYASEEDMQKAILKKPSILEKDLKPISYEKRIKPGFVDIYGIDKNGMLVVAEIKRKTAGREAVLQLAKYVKDVKTRSQREVRGILVAPAVAKGVLRLLSTLSLEFKALDPRKCTEILRNAEMKNLADFF